ncbi:MAG: hypothetical protein EOO27_30830, partial [Comamonadaceae bacterium]
NLDIGRPDQVALVFDRRLMSRRRRPTPGRFRTRVITEGVSATRSMKHQAVERDPYTTNLTSKTGYAASSPLARQLAAVIGSAGAVVETWAHRLVRRHCKTQLGVGRDLPVPHGYRKGVTTTIQRHTGDRSRRRSSGRRASTGSAPCGAMPGCAPPPTASPRSHRGRTPVPDAVYLVVLCGHCIAPIRQHLLLRRRSWPAPPYT